MKICTCFGIGYSPMLSGTMASIAGLAIYLLFLRQNSVLHLVLVLILTVVGFALCGKAEKLIGKKDARQIVIDDLNGMLLGLLFLPFNLYLALAGFAVFRVMDGLKPYPIYKIEKCHGSLGIMGDDLLAGLFTNIVLQILVRFSCFNFS